MKIFYILTLFALTGNFINARPVEDYQIDADDTENYNVPEINQLINQIEQSIKNQKQTYDSHNNLPEKTQKITHSQRTDTLYPVVLLHGILSDKSELNTVYEWLKTKIPNDIYNIEIGNGRTDSIFKSMDWQLKQVCETIYSIPDLAAGFHFIGMSQGGLLARGYVERCNIYPVINLITWVSPHAGVFGLGGYDIDFTKIYTPKFQSLFSFAGYWKDPFRYGEYLNNSGYLADLNNEHKHNGLSVSQKYNMLSLKNFVMIWSPEDDVLKPPESGKFAFYKIFGKSSSYMRNIEYDVKTYCEYDNLPIVELQDSPQYTEDWLGLRTLNETGRLHILETNCTHTGHKTEDCFPQLESLTFPFL